MKALLLLFGESFRYGSQHNRNRGTEKSYKEQIEAAKTHIKFIKHLKEKFNINMCVSINSYDTKYNNDLIKIYDDNNLLIKTIFYKELIGQNKLIHNYINKADIKPYDFILYMRIDLFLKDKFITIFNPNSNKILFPSICSPTFKANNHPRINDMMLFIPKKFFKHINNIDLSHHTWNILVTKYNFVYKDLDSMINTYHDSDSEKDNNPLYYIVNRPENPITKSEKIFDKYKF
jgi:hypothetical protein